MDLWSTCWLTGAIITIEPNWLLHVVATQNFENVRRRNKLWPN
jgi:hypothetical protein